MTNPIQHARYVCAVLPCTALLSLAACAALDPSDDQQRAVSVVAARTGLDIDWGVPDPEGSQVLAKPLGATDVARLALCNHPTLRASVESIAAARADYVQAHLLPNPVLRFTLGFPIDGGAGNPGMGGLMQPLAALWRRPAAMDIADAKLRAAVMSTSDAALALVARAKRDHARLVFAERDLELETVTRELAAAELELVDLRLGEGEATRLERNRADLELVDASNRASDALARRERQRRVLLETCGLADVLEAPATDGRLVAIPAWIGNVTEADLMRLAEAQRLDLAAARVLVAGAIDEVRIAELRRIPNAAIGLGYQRNFQNRQALGPSVDLTVPLFDDGRAGVAKAEALSRIAVAEAERIRQSAIGEVRRAWVELRGQLANLARLRDSVLALATENRALAEESFEVGVVDRGAVLELQRRELRARLDVHRVELAAIETFLEIERAVGGSLAAFEEVAP